MGGKKISLDFKNKHYNNRLNELLVQESSQTPYVIHNDRLIRKISPIYFSSESKIGRAHFYSPTKKIGEWAIKTMHFNLFVIWMMFFAVYFVIIVSTRNKNKIW